MNKVARLHLKNDTNEKTFNTKYFQIEVSLDVLTIIGYALSCLEDNDQCGDSIRDAGSCLGHVINMLVIEFYGEDLLSYPNVLAIKFYLWELKNESKNDSETNNEEG